MCLVIEEMGELVKKEMELGFRCLINWESETIKTSVHPKKP